MVNISNPHSHQGAHWVRAALQVNPFGYVGAGAPSNAFETEPDYNKALLDACEAEQIEMIAITDHWCIDSAEQLIADAAARNIVALPGFEANSAEGIHLLVLFAEGTKASTINAAIGKCGGDPGESGKIGAPYKDILSDMSKLGALVIPAHANVGNTGLFVSRAGAPLVEKVHHPHLHAVAISPGTPDAPAQKDIFKRRKPYDREHPLAKLFADDISHPSTLSLPGGSSWFKLSQPSLASLKHAVHIPVTRVRTRDPKSEPRPLLRGISWEGGFLDGVSITFADDLTNLIGGRGTGKSTVIESLRYALDVKPLGESALKDHDGVVRDVLGSGATIRLAVDAVSPTPGTYTIERTVFGPPVVIDPSGTATQLRPEDVTGRVDIYGQHELAELAQDSLLVASMIERFSKPTTSRATRDAVVRRLAENRQSIAKAEKRVKDLEDETADIPRLNAQVDRFRDTHVEARLEELKRLKQDEAVFREAEDRLAEAKRAIEDFAATELPSRLESNIELIEGSAQEDLLRKAEGAPKELARAIRDAINKLDRETDRAITKLSETKTAWTTATADQKEQHDVVLRELTEEGADPDKYLATVANLERLRIKEKLLPDARKKVTDLARDRASLISELTLADNAINRDFSGMVRDANKATSDAIRIQIVQAMRRDDVIKLINTIPGPKTQLVAAVSADGFSIPEFVAAVREGTEALESRYFVKGAQAAALLKMGEPFLRKLEELRIEQAVDVSLDTSIGQGATSWRKLKQLSKGQRATALLLLLLGASSSPLVIDQPEDDLDNRFVFREIVQTLRRLKGKRQVVASTHNANIPVLGDAELVTVLDGDGTHAWIAENGEGSLDNPVVLKFAEDLLEGGREAFSDRRHLYGF